MVTRRSWAFGLVVSMVGAGLVAVACGNSAPSVVFQGPVDSGPPPVLDSTVPILDGGPAPDVIPFGTLYVLPANQTIDVPPATGLTFHAYGNADASDELQASWSVDNQAIGTIDSSGVFTATGAVGGLVTIYAQAGQAIGQTTLTVRIHLTDEPPGLDGGVLGALQDGGTADPNFQWLYPYDETVFPRGILAPRLQWSGTNPQWVYVTASAKNLDFKGVYAPTNTDGLPNAPPQLDLSDKAWNAITLTAGAKDPVTIKVTKMDTAGQVTGPLTETWTIAQGSLKGIVYYNSYDSPLAAGGSDSGLDYGAVMRIRPGAAQPEVFIGGTAKGSCTVCHTLSANGSTMALSAGHNYDAVYGVSADASSPIGPISEQADNVYSFGALTPDGKYLLSSGTVGLDAGSDDAGPITLQDYGPNPVSMTHELDTRLFQTSDGGVVGTLPNVTKAVMPAFSPDSTKVAFNRYEPGQDQRLAVASFDEKTLTFGQYTDVFVDPGYYLSWPTFLPDSNSFVFMLSSDTDQYSTYQGGSFRDANGELLVYNPAVHDVAHMRRAMGQHLVATEGGQELATFLRNPNGTIAEQDRFKSYEPTALPVAAGGYYWVVFTSRRSYGNTIDNSVPALTPDDVKPKKLWVTAMDIDGVPEQDWSHPAFYLPGQELRAGNVRGFWALPPCESNGASCSSGTDCCNGFCRQVPGADGGPSFQCIAPPTGCSNVDEKCTTTSDCCAASQLGVVCIDGFCAIPTPK